MNALSTEVKDLLQAGLLRASSDPAVTAVLLRGEGGRSFAAGQDLGEAAQFTAESVGPWIDSFYGLYTSILECTKPTIAGVDGGFTTADIFLTTPPGGVFTQIVFALSGDSQTTSTFNITVTEGNGTVQISNPFSFNSGNSFFTVVAVNGQDIRNVNITTSEGEIDTLKQIRIGGLSPTQTGAVPEPASVVLFGAALLPAVFLYRKRFGAAR